MKLKLTVEQYKMLKQIGLLKENSNKIRMSVSALRKMLQY